MKRILCIILALVMMISLFPVSFAEEETAEATDPAMLEEDWLPTGDQEVSLEESDPDYEPVSLEDAIDLTEGLLQDDVNVLSADDTAEAYMDDGTGAVPYTVLDEEAITAAGYYGDSEGDGSPEEYEVSAAATVTKEVSGSCGPNTEYTIYYYSDGNVHMIISGTGAVTSTPWNKSYDVTYAWIQTGITSLPDSMFCTWTAVEHSINRTLKKVLVGDSVTDLGNGCFAGCEALVDVTLPDGLKVIPNNTFRGCSNLPSISLPSGITSIGFCAFAECSELTSLVLPDGLTYIGAQAFFNCNKLSGLKIPSKVTTLGYDAFYQCKSLTSITIPSSVKEIGGSAFYDCDGLTTVTLSSGITYVGSSMFSACDHLTSVSIPETVTSIDGNAFGYCPALKALTIPSGVKTIGSNAFRNATGLTLTFRGDAPSFASDSFNGATITCKYPGNNSTWVNSVLQNYGGTVTWENAIAPPYVTNVRKPTGALKHGAAFTIKGIIYPGGGTFSKVGALVYLASDTSYTTSKTGKQITYNSTKKYSIEGSTLDTSCKFGSLAPGNYVYIITATVDGKKYILDKSSFSIGTPQYTITYDGNGATTNIPKAQKKTYDKDLTLSPTVPTWDNYEFLGWSTSKSATEATYQPGGTYKANKTATLYAVWNRTGYKLMTYLNYSGKNYLSDTDFTGELEPYHWFSRDTSVATLSIDTETRHDGYNSLRIDNVSAGMKEGKKDLVFRSDTHRRTEDGYVGDSKNMILSFWAKSSNNGAKMYFRWGYEEVYRSVTLTTEWAKYSVRMDKTTAVNDCIQPYVDRAGTVWLAEIQLEDGTEATDFVPENGGFNTFVDAKVGGTYSLPAAPSRPGYTFLGWYTAAIGGSQITSSTSVKNGNLYVYAHWSGPAYSRSFTVAFDAGEGNCSIAEKMVTYHGTYGELPVPYRTGYRFLGWYMITEENDDLLITADSVMSKPENHTLYAQWEKIDLLELPSLTSVIEEEAFSGCAAEYILIPENITQIGTRAFADCAQLEVIEFCANSAEIAADAFENCTEMTIVAPAGGNIETFAADHNLTFVEKQVETLLPDV